MRRALKIRRGSRTITVDGITDTISGWALRIGLRPAAIDARIRNGWSEKKAVTTPRQKSYRRWGPRGAGGTGGTDRNGGNGDTE